MVGAEYDTHHGLTNAIVSTCGTAINAPAIEDKLPAMSRALGLQQADFGTFHAASVNYWTSSPFRRRCPIGVPVEAAGRLAEKAHQDAAAGTNPRPADVEPSSV